MGFFLTAVITLGVAWFGYGTSRRFVRERLRYVDAALSPGAAVVAAVGATLLAWPVATLLGSIVPFVAIGTGTALTFGLAIGLGTRAGATDVKQGYRLSDGG